MLTPALLYGFELFDQGMISVLVGTLEQDLKLVQQNSAGGIKIIAIQVLRLEQSMQCAHPETIHYRVLLRQLIVVAAVLGDQWLVDEMHRVTVAQA